jgi:hypothetical protein
MINLWKNVYIYDIEADELLDKVTKIHCLSVTWRDSSGVVRVLSTTDYSEMRKFFLNKNITRIGHNITLYDERVVAKILGIDTLGSRDQLIDTLPLSWYLYPERLKHGLEEWGKDLGIHKVEIKDWKNLSAQEYIHRCEVDTKINLKLWENCLTNLCQIYDNNESEIIRFIEYLQFKLDCVREQEDEKLKLDIPHIEKTLNKLVQEKEEKEEILRSAMPKVAIKTTKIYKDVIVLETGEFFQRGDMMFDHYFREGYRPKMTYIIESIKGYVEPNANSTDQKKNWLYSLGWVPENYKQVKDKKTGETRKIPQIKAKEDDGSICPSIVKLFEKEPKLQVLEGLTVLSHRIGILEGFLRDQKDGYIEASMAGLTNTLRLKHSKVVNLPGVNKKLGVEIRGSLIAGSDGILCGSDMSGLEDNCKQHYIFNYDPKYVTEMRTPGFDPHLDIGVLSGLITKKESDAYKSYELKAKDDLWKPTPEEKKEHSNTKPKRHKAKTTNFSATYGAGAAKIAATAGIPLKEGKLLHKIYWERNKAVKLTADACIVKQIGNKKWLFNPISKFWYSLRAEKDRFSTLNQGTGVYCFDTYIKHVRERGIKISLQMHDEILFNLKNDSYEQGIIRGKLQKAIEEVNKEIKLNVPLGISIDFGNSYADCH